MHVKSLTRCDLLGLLDLLESVPGLIPCGLCALASLGKFGLSNRCLALQGLTLLHHVLGLLLDLIDPGLELLRSGLLLNSLPLGFDQGLFQGLDLGHCSYTYHDPSVNIYYFTTFEYITGYYIP